MIFWGLAITATVAVFWAILRPILRPAGGRAQDNDVAIYQDQLRELDRDIARGILSEAEAANTRAEIARRLLAADARGPVMASNAPRGANVFAIGLIGVLITAGSLLTYAGTERLLLWGGMAPEAVDTLKADSTVTVAVGGTDVAIGPVFPGVGAPEMGDMPLVARDFSAERPSQEAFEEIVAEENAADEIEATPGDAALLDQLRAALVERPDDLTGHVLLVSATASIRRYGEAWRGQERVIEIKGPDATGDDFTTLAEHMIFAARGYVSPKAEDALARALELDPQNRRARYYSGAALAQNDQPEMAMRLWTGLLAEGGPFEPWKEPVREQVRQLAAGTGLPLPEGMLAGPSADDMEAAGDMTPEDRQAMIRGMVEGLAERLSTEGGTAPEWARLITALGVLGETDRARAIATEAQQVFAGQDAALAEIDAAASQLPQ